MRYVNEIEGLNMKRMANENEAIKICERLIIICIKK